MYLQLRTWAAICGQSPISLAPEVAQTVREVCLNDVREHNKSLLYRRSITRWWLKMKDAGTIAGAITAKLETASLEHPCVNLISLQTLCWCNFFCFWKAGYYPCLRLSSWVENFYAPYKQQYYKQTCNCPSSITSEWHMPMPAASWDPTICDASIFSPNAAVLDEELMLSSTHAPACRRVFSPPSECNGAVLESHIPENERPSSVIVPVLSKHITLQPPMTATRLTWNVLIPDTFKRRTEIANIRNIWLFW